MIDKPIIELDMEPFIEHDKELTDKYGSRNKANAGSSRGRKWWPDRVKLIQEQFPSVSEGEDWWYDALGDMDLLGSILRDVLRVDLNPSSNGRRLEIDPKEGKKRLRQLMGFDYTSEPFVIAFNTLISNHSRTQVARKTTISRSRVHRLLIGEDIPNRKDLEVIAKGYGKHPSFFREYRVDEIVRNIMARLEDMPEYTVDVYRKLKR